jgi:hypothetical protein
MDWLDSIIKTFFDFDAMWQVFPQLLGVDSSTLSSSRSPPR